MASTDDKLMQIRNGGAPVVTTVSSARSAGGTSLSCVALTNWSTTSGVPFITYKKKADGNIDNDTIQSWKGVVSGTTIGSMVLQNGTDSGNDVGDYVAIVPTSAWAEGIYDWADVEHDPATGAHEKEMITGRTAITSTATDDVAIVSDTSDSGKLKKVTLTNLIPDGAVTPEKLFTGTGDDWDAQDWTPTVTGFSGTPTINYAKYTQVGKLVTIYVAVIGTSNATTKFFTLPVQPAAWHDSQFGGVIMTGTASTNFFGASIFRTTTNQLQVYAGMQGNTGTPFSAWVASGTAAYNVAITYWAA